MQRERYQLPESITVALQRFNTTYQDALQSSSTSMGQAIEHMHKSSGKQIRPLLLLLTAEALGGQINDRILKGGVVLELIHVASLIHDDIIDESLERRGHPSINALLGNKKAVLIGDKMIATAFLTALKLNSPELLISLAQVGANLSEGELLQLDTSELSDTTEEQYYAIIKNKTASLLSGAIYCGATLAGEKDPERLDKFAKLGEELGYAFQIRDDIFDYLPTKELGKPSGNDLKEHKITLPLIYALAQNTVATRKALKVLRKQQLTRQEIDFLLNVARTTGGIEYATMKMREHLKRAKALVLELLQDSKARDSILQICDYIADRNK